MRVVERNSFRFLCLWNGIHSVFVPVVSALTRAPNRNGIDSVLHRKRNEFRSTEIDPTNGNILNSFRITDVLSTCTVNFRDLDIGANGYLIIVSSDESTIAEFTPTGLLVQEVLLPSGVTSLSGIGLDNVRGEAWVSGTNGTIWRLGGLPSVPEPASLRIWGLGALGLVGYRCRRRKHSPSTAKIG